MSVYQEIVQLFDNQGGAQYLGEAVTMKNHMLQCGDLAKLDGACDELIVAALTHDIGHLLIQDAARLQDLGVDAHHDDVGADWLAERFPRSVSESVRLHVAAKRYLVTTDPSYAAKLSQASIYTLKMQGGLMNDGEIQEFLSHPHYQDAIQVRLWDDQAKKPDAPSLELSEFRSEIENASR